MLDRAAERLDDLPHTRLVARSRWHETLAVGGPAGQPRFLNGAALLETALDPHRLLAQLLLIEEQFGRQRGTRWAQRPLDLDLLLYDRVSLETPQLTVPHPRMAWRRFVLEPAAEIAAEMVHPVTGWTIGRLLENLNAREKYVAVTGLAAQRVPLVEEVARRRAVWRIHEPLPPFPLRSRATGPSGATIGEGLECMDRWAAWLDRGRPEWGRAATVAMSDFWFGECAALGQALLPPDQSRELVRRFEGIRHRVVEPQLLVWLDPPNEVASQPWASAQQALREDLSRPGHCPVLRLAGADASVWLEELLGALDSM